MAKKIKLFQKHESPKYEARINDELLELIDLLLGDGKWEYDEIHIPKQIYCEYIEELIGFYDLEGKVVVYE
jgi:hypothetical protein